MTTVTVLINVFDDQATTEATAIHDIRVTFPVPELLTSTSNQIFTRYFNRPLESIRKEFEEPKGT